MEKRVHKPVRGHGWLLAVGMLGLLLGLPQGRARASGSAAALLASALSPQVLARFDRADFMETSPKDIALENRANPLQAWALAFFPTLLVKGATIGVAWTKAKTDAWAPYLVLIPSMGHSHFWETGVWWAGLIALGGDIIGSSILTYYFSQVNAAGGTPASQSSLWAGIAVLAVFFVYENISAPVLAMWRNKKLMRQFAPARDKGEERALRLPDSSWRRSPWPARPLAAIGPDLRLPGVPVGAGWSFSF